MKKALKFKRDRKHTLTLYSPPAPIGFVFFNAKWMFIQQNLRGEGPRLEEQFFASYMVDGLNY